MDYITGKLAVQPRQPWFQHPFGTFISAIRNAMPQPYAQRIEAAPSAARFRPTTGAIQAPRSQTRTRTPPPEPPLSEYSTPAVPDSAWCSQNFMLGAGMVILQPSTHKFVIVYDSTDEHWFLPRGRKDLGESLEKTALREAYEEVRSYYVSFIVWVIGIMYSQGIRSSFCPSISHRVRPPLLMILRHIFV